ncbi:MAG: hypothetical protein AAF493_15315, partial [Pseudomonadota bacterium]
MGRTLRVCAIGAAIIAVLLLGTVAAAWGSAAAIDRFRPQITTWLSANLGKDVSVTELAARWDGIKPVVSVRGLRLAEPKSGQPLATFADAAITIAPLESLRAGRLVTGKIRIHGATVQVVRTSSGEIRLIGADPDAGRDTSSPKTAGSSPANPETQSARGTGWLLDHQDIELRGAEIEWRDEHDADFATLFSHVDVDIAQVKEGVREITARMSFGAGSSQNVQGAISVRGDPTGPDWSGAVRASARTVDLDRFQRFLRLPPEALSGVGSFAVNAQIDAGRLQSGDIEFDTERVLPNHLRTQGQLTFERSTHGWVITMPSGRAITKTSNLDLSGATVEIAEHVGETNYQVSGLSLPVRDALAIHPLALPTRFAPWAERVSADTRIVAASLRYTEAQWQL